MIKDDIKKIRDKYVVPHMHAGTTFECEICTIEYLCRELEVARNG